MANIAQIYSDAIGRIATDSKEEVKAQVEDSAKKTELLRWRQDPITVELFKHLSDKAATTMSAAVSNAVAYHQTQNHDIIIQQLVAVHTIKEILKEYGK